MSKIGTVLARLTRLGTYLYRVDFTAHENDYDSDDEGDEWQWSHPIVFTHTKTRTGDETFANDSEIPYDTCERYTARTFWLRDSTTITKLIYDTMAIRRARGEMMPSWSLSVMAKAADAAWFK